MDDLSRLQSSRCILQPQPTGQIEKNIYLYFIYLGVNNSNIQSAS